MDFTRGAVIGAGTMGAGIAQTVAVAGVPVSLIDPFPGALARGIAGIESSLARLVAKGTLTEADANTARDRVEPTEDLKRAEDADLAIAQLDALAPPHAILASNTSSISITALAAATARPDRVIGMHFFNPVPVMTLVEVVRGARTSDATHATVDAFARALGKTPITVNDYPGFVSNRVLIPMLNEAAFCLMEGVATREAIDAVMKLGMAHPMGPLALADFIGLDVCLNIMDVLHRGLGDDKYRACPLLRQMVAAGKLGRKSGEGFYDYAKQ